MRENPSRERRIRVEMSMEKCSHLEGGTTAAKKEDNNEAASVEVEHAYGPFATKNEMAEAIEVETTAVGKQEESGSDTRNPARPPDQGCRAKDDGHTGTGDPWHRVTFPRQRRLLIMVLLLLAAFVLAVAISVTLHKSNTESSAAQTDDPFRLTFVGDADGRRSVKNYPLTVCSADCDSDDECRGDLICFQRRSLQDVPGCYGDNADLQGWDFCVQPGSKREEEYQAIRSKASNLIPGITNATLDNMESFRHPQRLAYHFIAKDPLWKTYSQWRKQQRFGMGCLWFQFYPDYMVQMMENLLHIHECDWDDGKNMTVTMCGKDEQVLGLTFTGKKWADKDNQHRLPLELSFLSNLQTLDLSGGSFWVGEPSDYYLLSGDDDDFYNYLYDTYYTHAGLELMFPSNASNWTLPSLKELRIVDSFGLEGMAIPSSLGLLTSLTKLDLSFNELSSSIPSEVGLLSNLTILYLQSNNLNGTLPEELGDLSLLKILNVEENYLEQYIPAGLCQEHDPMDQLATDWCWLPNHCCDT